MATATNNHHQQQASDMESAATIDSLASTPRSTLNGDGDAPPHLPQRVRFMCSFGGNILPRPHDNQLRYMGGDTRIVAVNRHTTFSALVAKLSKMCGGGGGGATSFSIKYQLPNEELDSLITVSTDEDVENMMEEYDRISLLNKSARIRLFIFPSGNNTSRASSISSISSLLDGSIKREHWFLDALNGGSGRGPGLERGQSEVSSIISEVPDYLFGLDHSDDHPRDPKFKLTKSSHLNDNNNNHPGSAPGSPNPVASSPFCSTSSSLAPVSHPAIPPDLPPVKTKPVNPTPTPTPVPVAEPVREAHYPGGGVVEGGSGEAVMQQQQHQTGYSSGPVWHYPGQPMQPVYYVRPGNLPVQQVPMGAQYMHQQIPMGQVPMGYSHQVYGGGGGGARGMTAVDHQPVYYRNAGMAGMIPSYPGMVLPGGPAEEMQGQGQGGVDVQMGRISQS